VPADKKAALQKLRAAIHAAAPGAEETISYGMPAFRLRRPRDRLLRRRVEALRVLPGGIVNEFADELAKYSTSKGTIRFQADKTAAGGARQEAGEGPHRGDAEARLTIVAYAFPTVAKSNPRRHSPCRVSLPSSGSTRRPRRASTFYTSIFPNSKILRVARYPEGGPGPVGSVMTVEFELDGQRMTALNGGPVFNFNESISLVIDCKDQAEVDHYWTKLIAGGGQESACGC
jgi:hypothetical protein